jgi:sigma-B regulation protein RsbU (phosphoserine phosphatase)
MIAHLKRLYRKSGRLDKVFLVTLVVAVILNYAAPTGDLSVLLTFAACILGLACGFKWMVWLLRKVIWRLRYRLLVAYLFIAVVPILLILVLVWLGAYVLTGQVAAYLVTSELERQTAELLMPARGLAYTAPAIRDQQAGWLASALRTRFSGLEVVVRSGGQVSRYPADSSAQPPAAGWGDASGLVRRDGRLYLWGHAAYKTTDAAKATDVTMTAPVTPGTLAQLLPGLGDLSFRRNEPGSPLEKLADNTFSERSSLPPAQNALDRDIYYPAMVLVAAWESPGTFGEDTLGLVTRYSAVLATIFPRKELISGSGETAASIVSTVFWVVVVFFVVVEMVSVVIGTRLTRSITAAVHALYLGTERIRVGDFSHRIGVRGDDQLAALGTSFNRMTEDLERLVEVAKEKERLQSEIEIAREVQNQLFPKSMPASKTLLLAAECRPARLVSGDYYDYATVGPRLALAIGDVAGKGISAALLMATLQSTMRTQLRAGQVLAVGAGNGGPVPALSPADLVSRLNQQLFAFTPPEKFATFFFALYDDATGLMTYTNAGHLPPILVRRGKASRLEVTGTVVGAFSFAEYTESTIQLEPGDLLACFTDGVTEPENEFVEMFGEDRLTDVILKHASCPSEEIIAAVMSSVRDWTGSPELQDDMTLLLARRV